MKSTIHLKRGKASTLSLETPTPKIDGVLKVQGYKDINKVRPAVRSAAQTGINAFVEQAIPQVCYRVIKVQTINRRCAVFEGEVPLNSRIFEQYLSGSTEAVVFVLTVGSPIDEQTTQWMNEDKLVEALFLESAAWLGIEDITKQFVLKLRSWATQQSLRITRRLGPGYSYPIEGQKIMWDLTDQQPLFELLGEANSSVRLLESSAMLPKMSRSGMFGLIPRQT